MSTGTPPRHIPRLLLLNSADRARVRAVARYLQQGWRVVVWDAERQAGLIQHGLPAAYQLGDHDDVFAAAVRHAAIQVGATLAHLFGPLVVVPATLGRRQDIAEIEQGLESRNVQVAHVVVDIPAETLGGDPAAEAMAGLLALHTANAHLDASGCDEAGIAAGLVPVLVQMGWLRQGAWVPKTPPRGWPDG